MDSLYIVMPAYNEEENLESVVAQWYPILEDKAEESRLVIADSGSTDRTHELLLQLQSEKYPKLLILSDTGKYHGPKLIALYDLAIRHEIDYIFQTDSDGQTNPEEFEAFWKDREHYSGIFGNRTVRGDGNDRAFVEHVVCFLLRIIFGVKVPDANAPFRLMRSDTVCKYLYRLPADYALPNIMMTTYYAFYEETCDFREISFKPRQAGTNSLNIPRIIKIGWQALGEFMQLKKAMKK